MHDWNVIFHAKSYYYVFIKTLKDDSYLKEYFTYSEEIHNEKSFFVMMPTMSEANDIQGQDYAKKYAHMLKAFIEDPKKQTLITEENILKTLIKEDKRNNFFKYLSKHQKNIVLFCYSDLELYVKDIEHPALILSKDDFLQSIGILERFKNIKDAIKQTNNPFKDPIEAFHLTSKDSP